MIKEIINCVPSVPMSFGCSKETSDRDGSFEYPQYTLWLRYYMRKNIRNIRKIFDFRSFIGPDLVDNLLVKMNSRHDYRDSKLCTISAFVVWVLNRIVPLRRFF